MPKGYIISRVDISDPEAYARYAAEATKAIAAHGGKPLARGGRWEALEGKARARNVVLEFESYEAARRYFNSRGISGARRRCAKARPRWRWFWSREFDMAKGYWIAHVEVHDPEAYKEIHRRQRRRLRQIRRPLSGARRKTRRRQGAASRARWSSNSRIMPRRSPATNPRNIDERLSCATPPRSSTS